MAPPRKPEFVQVREPVTFRGADGDVVVLKVGEIFAADHPDVRANPGFFKPLEPSRQRPAVEQMTAAPGERRG